MAEEKRPKQEKDKPLQAAPIKKEEAPTVSVAQDNLTAPIGEQAVKTDLNAPEELPDEVKKKLEKNKADRKTIKKKGKKKKTAKNGAVGIAHVKATYNNTIVALTDLTGNVLSWASAGMAGFKGPKKS
ncbi:MAG: 30S ribosomal protein S11, partial [Patescibacteria group bacterium]|nr:30S ribosomal protein S11 [Patescibacteria group bacterium]